MTTNAHITRRFSAGDVLDQRGDLESRLIVGSQFNELIIGTLSLSRGSRATRSQVEGIPVIIKEHLRHAEVYRVSTDMVTLIEHAAMSLDDTDIFTTSLMPTDAGFVRFDRPLVLVDIRGQHMLIHAMTWGPTFVKAADGSNTALGTLVSMWNDINTEVDFYAGQMNEEYGTKLRRIAGRWSFVGAEVLTDDSRVGPSRVDPARYGIEDTDVQPFTNAWRYVLALAMLMSQPIVTTGSERPNVHARRRAKAHKLPARDVTVIDLRRTYHREGDGHGSGESAQRDWHHRWVVRGHWRWARVGPGRQEIKRVWVSGHVKGPEDKPLVIKSKVYDVK